MSSTLEGHISELRDPMSIILNSNRIYVSQSLECATQIEVSSKLNSYARFENLKLVRAWFICKPIHIPPTLIHPIFGQTPLYTLGGVYRFLVENGMYKV